MLNFVVLVYLIASFLAPVTPYNFKDHEEGSCGQYTLHEDFNLDWFSKAPLPYVSAGSKYHLYRMTAGVPDHENISEENFLQNACIHSVANATTGIGQLFAFGLGNVGNFQITPTDQNGVMDFMCLDTPDEKYVSRHTVTLTDNESFVLFANCWEDTQQRGWDVISSTITLDARKRQMITEHLTSLGFDPAESVFFPGEKCEEMNMKDEL